MRLRLRLRLGLAGRGNRGRMHDVMIPYGTRYHAQTVDSSFKSRRLLNNNQNYITREYSQIKHGYKSKMVKDKETVIRSAMPIPQFIHTSI